MAKTLEQIQNELMQPLHSNELQLRVGRIANGGAVLLLYKDSRADTRRLNDVLGVFGWKRSHAFKEGINYCTVSIRNPETGEWVSREDCGTESKTEAEKGQSSDAFKRACFAFGIGIELYDTPTIFVPGVDKFTKVGEWTVRMAVDKDSKELRLLQVVDQQGVSKFVWKHPQYNKESVIVW